MEPPSLVNRASRRRRATRCEQDADALQAGRLPARAQRATFRSSGGRAGFAARIDSFVRLAGAASPVRGRRRRLVLAREHDQGRVARSVPPSAERARRASKASSRARSFARVVDELDRLSGPRFDAPSRSRLARPIRHERQPLRTPEHTPSRAHHAKGGARATQRTPLHEPSARAWVSARRGGRRGSRATSRASRATPACSTPRRRPRPSCSCRCSRGGERPRR